jgi:bifunctional DNA-binding transcriptional regulator/antitoxin component of YhaV-PrlF toxin-antitoxin module
VSPTVPFTSTRYSKGVSVISRKNQVTLPVEALRAAGLEPGDDVRIEVLGPGRLELVRADDLVKEFASIFDSRVYPKGYLEELRRGWP